MEQTDKEVAQGPESTPGRMNAEDAGYGGVSGRGQPGSAGGSETAPLLIPDPEPEPDRQCKPMTKQELEAAAGGPGWRKARCYMVLLFWLVWVAMLAASVAFIVMSPRPGVTPLQWWQKSLFYRLQPDLFLRSRSARSGGINAMCEQLPYLKSLGIGAVILEGLFHDEAYPPSINGSDRFGTFPQIKHLITASNKTGLKMVLDLCELDLLGPHDVSRNADTVQHALRFWLEQGVAGFAICDTDAYSEKDLLGWRGVINEFSRKDDERIVVVKQTRDFLPPLNVTLVDLVMRSILPSSHHRLSAHEVVAAIKTNLQTTGEEQIRPSWTIGGKASRSLKKLLLLLMMTMPGSPAVQYDAVGLTQNETLKVGSSSEEETESSDSHEDNWRSNSTAALFRSLSRSRAREAALLSGSLTFLPYSTFSNSTSSSYPMLAFMRSWSCVRFLVLLNVGSEVHILDPNWAPGLPREGVFVASTGMDRMGPTSLYTLELQPHEAVVIKF